jgi:hypothetical protein
MQNVEQSYPVLPAGFKLIKIGGRPKKEARDAAVFLAKFWRKEVHQEKSTKAEQWIVENWESLGSKASKGISEAAHVRASIKRSRSRGMNSCLLVFDPKTNFCMAIECEKHPTGPLLKGGERAWSWVAGMAEAVYGKLENPTVTTRQEVLHPTPIASAINSLVRGLS